MSHCFETFECIRSHFEVNFSINKINIRDCQKPQQGQTWMYAIYSVAPSEEKIQCNVFFFCMVIENCLKKLLIKKITLKPEPSIEISCGNKNYEL